MDKNDKIMQRVRELLDIQSVAGQSHNLYEEYSSEEQEKKYVWKEEDRRCAEVLQDFSEKTGIKVKWAFGNPQMQIEDVFQEEPNEFSVQKLLDQDIYPGGPIDFMGNINGKTANQLYFKNASIFNAMKEVVLRLRAVRDEFGETINQVENRWGRYDAHAKTEDNSIETKLVQKFYDKFEVGDAFYDMTEYNDEYIVWNYPNYLDSYRNEEGYKEGFDEEEEYLIELMDYARELGYEGSHWWIGDNVYSF